MSDYRTPEPVASPRHTVRFVLIVVGIGVAGLIQARHSAQARVPNHLPLYISITALQLLFVWFVNKGIRARGHSLAELIGRKWHGPSNAAIDCVLAIAFVALLRVSMWALRQVLGAPPANVSFLLPTDAVESAAWIVVAIAAGICEEIVYRGYLQRQLWSLMRSLPAAISLQALIFAAGHVYQGWRPAVITGVYGLAFGLLAGWRKSIIPGAIAHSLIDILGGLLRR